MPIKKPGWNRYVARRGVGGQIRFRVGSFKRKVWSSPKGGGWKTKKAKPNSAFGDYADYLDWADRQGNEDGQEEQAKDV